MGPAFMQGLMGGGQPLARYDDMFCGWASKVVGDHIDLGTKSGSPYIKHNKASNPFTNLKKEYKGIFWLEHAIKFFQDVQLTSESKDARSAYRELAGKVKFALGDLHPYFIRLSDAMYIWVDLWEERNPGNSIQGPLPPRLHVRASRSSIGPQEGSSCAVFTVTHNEKEFLPIWLRYYGKHVPFGDIWILDHNSTDGSTNQMNFPKGIKYKALHGDAHFMPHHFLNRQVEFHQQRLLRAGYPCVLFTEIDELIIPDPSKYPKGLGEFLTYYAESGPNSVRATGYEILHKTENLVGEKETKLDWSLPLLQQRHFSARSKPHDKPLLTKVPLNYVPGFHDVTSFAAANFTDPDLILAHMHSIDSDYCLYRESSKHKGAMDNVHGRHSDEVGMGFHFAEKFESLRQSKQICSWQLTAAISNISYANSNSELVIPEKWRLVDV